MHSCQLRLCYALHSYTCIAVTLTGSKHCQLARPACCARVCTCRNPVKYQACWPFEQLSLFVALQFTDSTLGDSLVAHAQQQQQGQQQLRRLQQASPAPGVPGTSPAPGASPSPAPGATAPGTSPAPGGESIQLVTLCRQLVTCCASQTVSQWNRSFSAFALLWRHH
jgi:hypothetical protein